MLVLPRLVGNASPCTVRRVVRPVIPRLACARHTAGRPCARAWCTVRVARCALARHALVQPRHRVAHRRAVDTLRAYYPTPAPATATAKGGVRRSRRRGATVRGGLWTTCIHRAAWSRRRGAELSMPLWRPAPAPRVRMIHAPSASR